VEARTKPAIKKFFILSGSVPLDLTQGVKTLGYALLLSSMDDGTSEIHI
jgi:hypothetical protein